MKTKKESVLGKLEVNNDLLAARPFLRALVKAWDETVKEASETQKRLLLMEVFLDLRKLC